MLKESLSLLKKDKVILLCSLFPILIGFLLYFFLGSWLYNDVLLAGNEYIKLKTEGWAGALSFLFGGLLAIAFYFIINWTFVLLVSLIAAPFNDLVSSRVEKIKNGAPLSGMNESLMQAMNRFTKMLGNEIKKVFFIIFLSLIAFACSFFFPPLGFLLSAILVSISFIDYSWSRHELPFKDCLLDYKRGLFRYCFGGAIFTLLFGIPIVNLISYPIAVIYFTLHYVKTNS